jgi:hypothetical protein
VPDHGRFTAWHGRACAVSLSTVLNFAPDGLVLGAAQLFLAPMAPDRYKRWQARRPGNGNDRACLSLFDSFESPGTPRGISIRGS